MRPPGIQPARALPFSFHALNPIKPVMIVTGGGRGIGAATARLAAGRGYAVCVNYAQRPAGGRRGGRGHPAAGGEAIAVQADVSREADVLRLFDETTRALGRLAALVNNAGILEQQTRLDAMTADRFERVFAVNITGAFLCAREAVRRMSTRHGGRGGAIVNVGSMASTLGSPGEYVDYAASKGAVDSLTIGLAREVADEGIRVNAVRPGVIHTEIHASGGEPGRVERVKNAVPMQRGGQPEEVARAILWLLSDEASYTTGSFIEVSGGR